MTGVFTLAALLLYPGLLLVVLLGLVLGLLTQRRPPATLLAALGTPLRPAAWTSEHATSFISIALAALGLALLPLPYNPLTLPPHIWLWSWAAFELAFLLPLLPALLAGTPPVVRAAMRAAQIGLLGRALLWLGLAVGLLLFTTWEVVGPRGQSPLLAHGLAALAALLAFGPAVGWGIFGTPALALDDMQRGLDQPTIALAAAAHTLRTAALLGASLAALLPLALLPPWAALLLWGGAYGVACLLLRQRPDSGPHLTLQAALRRCWWRALPLAAAAVLYMSLV